MTPRGIIVGSRAMAYWYSDARACAESDVDVYIPENDISDVLPKLEHWSMGKWGVYIGYTKGLKLEIHVLTPDHPLTDSTLSAPMGETIFQLDLPFLCVVATPEALLALKQSHVHTPVHWFKTISDYHFLQRKLNFVSLSPPAMMLCEYEQRCVDERVRVRTNLKKEDFFNQHHVVRYIDHDVLHDRVKIHVQPMYQLYLQEGADVQCDKNKWDNLSTTQQLDGVREEACVLAIERVLLPALMQDKGVNLTWTPLQAYRWALMRICTNLTSGWFRQFAIEHYPELSALPVDIEAVTSKVYIELKTV